MSVRVLSTLHFPSSWLEAVAAVSPEVVVEQIPAASVEELPPDVLADVEVLYTTTAFPAPAQAPNLRWVQLDTSGADHVRASALWSAPDVAITSLGGVSPRPMAEYVMAMVLSFAHRLPTAARRRAERHWPTERERWQLYRPAHLPGSRMAIVGYGRIGRGIAGLATEFGIEVVGVSRSGVRSYGRDVPGVEVVGVAALDDALAGRDWLVSCAPATPETQGLIGAEQLAALNPGAHLIDVGRGGVVDEEATRAALDAGTLGGAALDVFSEEPLPADSPWWAHPRVVLTPHISGLASDYEERVLALFKDNVARYLAGRPLLNVVDRQLGY